MATLSVTIPNAKAAEVIAAFAADGSRAAGETDAQFMDRKFREICVAKVDAYRAAQAAAAKVAPTTTEFGG